MGHSTWWNDNGRTFCFLLWLVMRSHGYIIPLAKKLKSCGIFGVSSDEYLNYALHNRREWAVRGEKVVGDMKKRFLFECQDAERADKGISVENSRFGSLLLLSRVN
jgi:hypothetical protein